MAACRAGAGRSVVDAVTVDDSGWRQMYFLVEIFYSTLIHSVWKKIYLL